ncbi:MAG: hypothetical protein ACJ0SM_04805 [Arenicellales bacterium]
MLMGKRAVFYIALIIFMIIAPFVFPVFKTQLATVWLMIIVALTWDMTGGQMGYNSLGNITFYGTGMYVAAVVVIALAYDVGEYTVLLVEESTNLLIASISPACFWACWQQVFSVRWSRL